MNPILEKRNKRKRTLKDIAVENLCKIILLNYCDVEFLDFIRKNNGYEITLYDHLDKGIDFEDDIESIQKELEQFDFKINTDFYDDDEECYEMAFIKIIS